MSRSDNISKRHTKLSKAKQALLEKRLRGEFSGTSELRIVPRRQEGFSIPLSFAQERLWLLDQVMPGTHFFNISRAVRLTGLLNVAALEQSLQEIVRRHEALRTKFVTVDGQPVQVVAPTTNVKLTVVSLRELPAREREVEAQRLVKKEALRPFDLVQGPLLRVSLLCIGEQEYVLILTMHHIISDGWSMGVLIAETVALYEAFSRGKPSPLPELRIQYPDFALWQRQRLQEKTLESQMIYWKRELDGSLSVLEFHADHPRPAVESFCTSCQSFAITGALFDAFVALGRREETTIFMTLLASLNTLLYQYTGQEDIRVGTLVANRNRSEIEGLIGLFVNTVILRTHVSGHSTFHELLEQVREKTLGAYANQDFPFEELIQAMEREHELKRATLFQVMLLLQNVPLQPMNLRGLAVSSLEAGKGSVEAEMTVTTCDLIFVLGEISTGLAGSLIYKTDVFEATTIKRMLRYFLDLLEALISRPHQAISALPLPNTGRV